MNVNEESGT